MRTDRRFDFHIDLATADEIAGWAVNLERFDAPLTLEFALGDVTIGVARAERARPDVEKLGRGPRHCGFRWSLPKLVAELGVEGEVPVEIRALGPDDARTLLTTVVIDFTKGLQPQQREALQSPLVAALNAITRAAIEHGTDLDERREAGRFPLHERLFLAPAETGSGTARLSPYLEFTQKRLRKEGDFPLDGGVTARNNFVRWYLEVYGVNRRPMRVPLGAPEIAYLNEPVPLTGVPYKLSRISLSYALTSAEGAQLVPVTDLSRYENFVAWWATRHAPGLNIEDCLVPDYYIEVLRRVPQQYMGKPFGLSVHMLRRFNADSRFHVLDMGDGEHRKLFHVWLLLEAMNSPGEIRFLPPSNISALLEGPRGETEFDRVVQSVHESGKGLRDMFDAERYSQYLLRKGFDVRRRRFIFTDQAGNRFEAARWAPARARQAERVDLQVIGPFEKASGLGQATRLSGATIRRTGLPARFVNFGLDNPAPTGMSSASGAADQPVPARVNLLHLNGESVPIALAYMPDVFDGAYNIGYFFWELSKPAKTQRLALDLLDEIWVSTEYGVSIYQPEVDIPVRNVGMAVEPVPDPGREAGRAYVTRRLPAGPDTFVFLASFDSFSFLERKNPHGLVNAFRDAFGPADDVLLVLKTHNRDFVIDKHQAMRWERILEIAASDHRIVILNETLPYSELITLKRGADCYVSLHRSEGWGFGLIESMALGVPVLATGYSGNMDFTRPDHSWLVDYDLVAPRPNEYIFVDEGQVWAEPRHESAVAQLRAVRQQHAERERRAERARAFVEKNFSLDAQAAKYRARLDEIMATLKG